MAASTPEATPAVEDPASSTAFEADEPLAAAAEAGWRPYGWNGLVDVVPLVVILAGPIEYPYTVGLRLQTDATDGVSAIRPTQTHGKAAEVT